MPRKKKNQLNHADAAPIEALQRLTPRKLPRLEEYNPYKPGYVVDDSGAVTALSLRGCGLDDEALKAACPPLKALKALKSLSLHDNNLTDVSPLAALTALQSLDLGGNNLTDVSPLAALTALTSLNLWGNEVTDVSPLAALTALQSLYLADNKVTDVSPLAALTALTWLRLGCNKIKDLPEWITRRRMQIYCGGDYHGEGIDLKDNPLKTPPLEIVKQGKDAIRRYFADRQRTGTRPINEVKVLLVGDGGAGKTCLVKRIIYNTYNPKEKKTHGIYIDHWPIKITDRDITVHFWDFGGQGLMQATHQLFFSVRSLYILVVNARQEADPEDWFKSIVSYGGDSPILVVINKIDENPYNLNEKDLQRKYPNIKGFFHISCKKGWGIADFRKQLKRHLASVKMLESAWPINRAEVRDAIEKLKKDYIDYDRYQKICQAKRLADEPSQLDLLTTLNDLGVITYFDLPGLKHRQVLKPDWVTVPIYRIINSRRLKEQHGIMPTAELEYVLNEERLEDEKKRRKRQTYNAEERDYIVALMKQFELCYALGRGKRQRLVVPDLLVANESNYRLDGPLAVRLRLCYHFLPRSVLGRFMVKHHRDLNIDQSWRTGAVLKSPLHKTKAAVRVDPAKRQIDIEVAGERSRDHLTAIRQTLWAINNRLRLKPTEWIPLPDSDQAVQYDELYGHWLDRREEYYSGKLRTSFSVQELLDGIENPEKRKMKTEHGSSQHGDKIGGDINVYGGSPRIIQNKMQGNIKNTTFGDKIITNHKEKFGLSAEEFTDLIRAINQLSADQQARLVQSSQNLHLAKSEEEKQSLTKKIKDHLVSYGIGVAGSLTANGVWLLAANMLPK